MTQPDPSRLYDVVCPACLAFLGKVYARHADYLAEQHAARCKSTPDEKQAAAYEVEFAAITGDTSVLDRRMRDG